MQLLRMIRFIAGVMGLVLAISEMVHFLNQTFPLPSRRLAFWQERKLSRSQLVLKMFVLLILAGRHIAGGMAYMEH